MKFKNSELMHKMIELGFDRKLIDVDCHEDDEIVCGDLNDQYRSSTIIIALHNGLYQLFQIKVPLEISFSRSLLKDNRCYSYSVVPGEFIESMFQTYKDAKSFFDYRSQNTKA